MPGPKTAILAGSLYLAATLILFGFTMMGMMSMALFVKGSALRRRLDACGERGGRGRL